MSWYKYSHFLKYTKGCSNMWFSGLTIGAVLGYATGVTVSQVTKKI